MSTRNLVWREIAKLCACLLIAIVFFSTSLLADEQQKTDKPANGKRFVSLILAKASAERRPSGLVVRCEAILENATGQTVTGSFQYLSLFDLVEVVVTTKDGKTLAQQPYFYNSPLSLPRRFELKPGKNSDSLVFTLTDGVLKNLSEFRIRLVGTLPGSEYKRILSSETLEVEVK